MSARITCGFFCGVVFWLGLVLFSLFIFLMGVPVETSLGMVLKLGEPVGTPLNMLLL